MNQLVRGLLMVILGLLFLFILRRGEFNGELAVALIGSGFLVAYALSGTYSFLVPGGIMTGLGAGIAWPRVPGGDSVVVLGLGLGFLLIFVVDRLTTYEGGWWPLIPGGALVFVGLLSGSRGMLAVLQLWWPLALVAVGVWVMLRGRRRRGGPDRKVE